MTFIAEALRPVFEKIGQWIRWAGEKAQEFVMGFSAGIDGLMPALGDLGGELQIIGTDIASLFRAISEDLMPSMMDFGDFLGTTLVAAVRVVTMVLGFLWATLKGIFKTVKSLIQVLTGDFSGAWETFSSISDDYARTFEMMGRQGTAIAEGYRRMDRRMVQRGAAAEMQRSGTGLAEWHPGEGGPRGRTGLRPVNNTINRSAQLSSTVRIDRMEVNARTPEEAAQVGRSIADISEREQRDRARRLYDQDLQGRDQVRRSTTTIRLGTITQ
jgi:fluoride ion exporter CrcB/FEX